MRRYTPLSRSNTSSTAVAVPLPPLGKAKGGQAGRTRADDGYLLHVVLTTHKR